ncbi:MAG: putative Serine/threonine-protein kinase ATG1a [Streblomastix strix]|uniref:Putative Serine/threonine-protein kinase ATG1a n=1 Tax=Streblomastix strix TaxID=222440 RepID=A0A5J4X5L8_9EUKA|nr:MAG: putative Serine/threonine-protein kinase ATG1a [Streblomastix strix]
MEDLQLLEQNNIDAIKTLVYQAFHKDYGVIAAKVMRLEKFDKKEWDAVQVLNKPEFQCPFLMKYLFARQLDNYVVIVMSYANTKSLDNIIKIHNQHLSMTTYRALAKQLLEGLKIIHSAKLIHRDIKSENILLHTEHGTTKVQIADFGLAKICAEEQMAITTCGTPLNMVDIYSMGVVLFQLAAHEYPIQAKSISELQQKLKLKRINRPSVLKDDLLWDLLSQMLNFDPNRRISAEQALQHPFFTSQQAQSEITQLVKELTQNAINAQQRGETWVTEYDINSSFIVPSSDIAVKIIFLNINNLNYY